MGQILTERPLPLTHRPSAGRQFLQSPTVSIIAIGAIVGVSYTLAKFAVANGIPPFAALFWQLFGATIILLAAMVVRGKRLDLSPQYLRYYIISGLLGVSGPQLIAYVVLKHIPAGLFTTLITLSPLATFMMVSVVDRQLLPLYRLAGILLGLIGISMATLSSFDAGNSGYVWVIAALGAPLLLASGNIYRNRAYPKGADPLALATGMLGSQMLLVWPVLIYRGYSFSPVDIAGTVEAAVLIIGALTAIGYILTFAVQRTTDGVGFSQVGYFATLSGIAAGAVLFAEPLSPLLFVSIAVLFLGLAVTNGHLNLPWR
ncbi:DMT family transporter [Hoeflea sp. TYP-13]|uniref:DMT family transporter n=1 Tax=Hoeflea sp. TYP-13 TaxID=3230023 RepID=UPI0034C6A096